MMDTTTYNLQGFIAECVTQIRTLADLRYVPDNPPLQVSVWPMVTVFASDGEFIDQPAGLLMTGLNNVTIAVILPTGNDLEKVIDFLLPYCEQIPMTLFKYFTKNNSSSHAQKIGAISYTIGPIEWGGIDMFGFLFTIQDVKIQNEVTA